MAREGIITALFALVFCAGIGVAAFVFTGTGTSTTPAPAAPLPVRQEPGVEVWYVNESLFFTFGVPSGLLADEGFTNPGSVDVSLHTAAGQEYLSVHAEKVADAVPLELETVPGEDASVVDVADSTGILFSSERATWGGPSRELWFDRDDYRYQVSVRAQDAALLDFVRSTWHWEER